MGHLNFDHVNEGEYRVTYRVLFDWYMANQGLFETLEISMDPEDPDDSPFEAFQYYMWGDAPGGLDYLYENAVRWYKEGIIYNPAYFPVAQELATFVNDAYESDISSSHHKYSHEFCSFIWDSLLLLGGDDSVDYAGSHPSMIIEFLEVYHNRDK